MLLMSLPTDKTSVVYLLLTKFAFLFCHAIADSQKIGLTLKWKPGYRFEVITSRCFLTADAILMQHVMGFVCFAS